MSIRRTRSKPRYNPYAGVSDAAAVAALTAAETAAATTESKYGGVKFGPVLPPAMAAKRKRSRSAALRNVRTEGLLGIELKYKDEARADVAMSTTLAGGEYDSAANSCLGGIAQGDAANTRDGNRVVYKGIHLNGYIEIPDAKDQADPPEDGVGWLALVLDKQTNGAQIQCEQVYTCQTSPEIPFRLIESVKRCQVLWYFPFQIHWDYCQTDGANTGSHHAKDISFRVDKKFNIPCQFNADGATVASINDNSFHLIGVTNYPGVTLTYECRTRFIG